MQVLFADYYWKNGRPQGSIPVSTNDKINYKIVADPYFKHISLEEYYLGHFNRLIYDSRLLDFRVLRSELPAAWQKTEENTENDSKRVIIRDHNDRLTWIETYTFRDGVCKECKVFSPHGLHLSTHIIRLKSFGEDFDGVELFDSNNKLVMHKKYALTDSMEFGDLVEENWELQNQIK